MFINFLNVSWILHLHINVGDYSSKKVRKEKVGGMRICREMDKVIEKKTVGTRLDGARGIKLM